MTGFRWGAAAPHEDTTGATGGLHSRAGAGYRGGALFPPEMMPPESPSPQRVSLRDIAKALGVSHATVSMALRDLPQISAEMRGKVHALAREMGYRPDPVLGALAHYRKGKTAPAMEAVLAWVNCWPRPAELRVHREFDGYWRGAQAAAERSGYRLEEFRVGGGAAGLAPKRLEQVLRTRNIAGMLLAPLPPEPEAPAHGWLDFAWEHFSIVRLGRSWKMPRAQVVTSDQVGNTMLACGRMRERGYERVGFAMAEGSFPGVLFRAGFLAAQADLAPGLRLPVFTAEKGRPRRGRRGSWRRGCGSTSRMRS